MLDLNAARELCEAATKGPWTAEEKSSGPRITMQGEEPYWTLDNFSSAVWDCDDELDGCPDIAREWAATSRFIAAARTLLPAALDEIEELRKNVSGLYIKTLEPAETHDELVHDLEEAKKEITELRRRLELGDEALEVAVTCLLDVSWEGSSVNFPARNALNKSLELGFPALIDRCREARNHEWEKK